MASHSVRVLLFGPDLPGVSGSSEDKLNYDLSHGGGGGGGGGGTGYADRHNFCGNGGTAWA